MNINEKFYSDRFDYIISETNQSPKLEPMKEIIRKKFNLDIKPSFFGVPVDSAKYVELLSEYNTKVSKEIHYLEVTFINYKESLNKIVDERYERTQNYFKNLNEKQRKKLLIYKDKITLYRGYTAEGIEVKLVIELLTSDGFIKLEDEIDNVPLFRPYITTPHGSEFSLDTYIYNPIKKKFESLEIIDQETLVDEGISSELINNFYSFHQRLMETSSRKIKLWTAQPEKRIALWNKQGFIPKNSYLTDDVRRAEYYFNPEEHDVIVFYRVPENQLIMTSNAFGAKEYVTLNDVKIE